MSISTHLIFEGANEGMHHETDVLRQLSSLWSGNEKGNLPPLL